MFESLQELKRKMPGLSQALHFPAKLPGVGGQISLNFCFHNWKMETLTHNSVCGAAQIS